MTQIFNFSDKLVLEEKFKICTSNKLKIDYDFKNEEKYLNIGNKLILKIIKVGKSQKYNKDDIFESKQNNEYEIIIKYLIIYQKKKILLIMLFLKINKIKNK